MPTIGLERRGERARSGRRTLGWGLGLALLLALSAGAGARAEEPWDQARVTELAQQLDAAVKRLLADPGLTARQASAMQDRRQHSAIVSVREFGRRAANLAQQLARGRGRDQTRGVWDQMMMVREDVRFYAENSSFPESVNLRARAVGGLIDEIDPFYTND